MRRIAPSVCSFRHLQLSSATVHLPQSVRCSSKPLSFSGFLRFYTAVSQKSIGSHNFERRPNTRRRDSDSESTRVVEPLQKDEADVFGTVSRNPGKSISQELRQTSEISDNLAHRDSRSGSDFRNSTSDPAGEPWKTRRRSPNRNDFWKRDFQSVGGAIDLSDKYVGNEGVEEPALTKEDLEHDQFGTISDPDFHNLKQYEDAEEEDIVKIVPFKQRPYWYMIKMQKFIRKDDLPGALEFFEVRMRKEDQVRPLRSVYNMLIAACGRAGYTAKAFWLYNDMKSRRFDPIDATYVGLFNACAESPWKDDGLRRAQKLRDQLQLKGHTPNQIVYHSMLKAFGRSGDVATAFQIADEMVANQVPIIGESFSFLLMACISDSTSGLKHAIEVWRVMIKSGVKPNLFHYNLLLKAIRECGIGSPDLANQLLPSPPSPTAPLLLKTQQHRQLSVSDSDGDGDSITQRLMRQARGDHKSVRGAPGIVARTQSQPTDQTFQLSVTQEMSVVRPGVGDEPFLYTKYQHKVNPDHPSGLVQSLSKRLRIEAYMQRAKKRKDDYRFWWGEEALPQQNNLIPDLLLPLDCVENTTDIAIGEPKNAMERIELFGGYSGFLSHMYRNQVKPDEKCLTQLIEVLPNTRFAEEDILNLSKKLRIRLGTDFYNILIKKRNLRHNFVGAMEIYRLMDSSGLYISDMTFGCLALGCDTQETAVQLLEDMKIREVKPNVKIFGALVRKATMKNDVWYVIQLLNKMEETGVAPDARLLESIEKFRTLVKRNIIAEEKNELLPEKQQIEMTPGFKNSWRIFQLRYKKWLIAMPAPVEQHPWKPYFYAKNISEKEITKN